MSGEQSTQQTESVKHDSGHHEIPWSELIVPQVVNFTLFLAVLIYFARKPIADYFTARHKEYEEKRKQAAAHKADADQKNFEIRSRLRELEESATQSLSEAQNEARALKDKLLADAKDQAARIKTESGQMIHFEKSRAISALTTQLILSASKLAEEKISNKMTKEVQVKLNDDFVSRVQGRA